MRVNTRLGIAAFLSQAGRVLALSTVDRATPREELLEQHPPYEVRVSPGGTIAHPGRAGLRIYVGDAYVDSFVRLESRVDGWVTVHAGEVLLVSRRWLDVLAGVAPDDESLRVPDDVSVPATFTVDGEGYLDTGRGRFLVRAAPGWPVGRGLGRR